MGLLDFAQQPGLLSASPQVGGLLSSPAQPDIGSILRDPTFLVSLLGRGNLGENVQRGLASSQARQAQQQENQIKGLLYGSQIAENNSQAALRGAQVKKLQGDQDIIRGILPGWGAAPAAGGMPGGVPGGMPSAGGASAPGQAPDLSRVDVRAVSRDLIKDLKGEQVLALENAGLKGVTDIWKELRPKMQVAGGYAYDANSVPTGFLPQVSTSANGQTSLIRPDGAGGVTVAPPPGAMSTYGGYKTLDAGTQAAFTPGRPAIGAGGRMVGQSQAQEIGIGAPATAPSAAPIGGEAGLRSQIPGDMGFNPTAAQNEINATMRDLQNPNLGPKDREMMMGHIQNMRTQLATYGNQPTAQTASPGPAAVDFSPAEKGAQGAAQKFQADTAEKDSRQLDDWRAAALSANQALQSVSNLRAAVKQGVYSGGGSQAKVAISNLINGLTGITPSDLVGSEKFNAEASQAVLGSVKALGQNPSNADRDFIYKTVPNLGTSPEARDALINFMEQKARGGIDLYKRADAYAREKNGLGGFDPFQGSPQQEQGAPSIAGISKDDIAAELARRRKMNGR